MKLRYALLAIAMLPAPAAAITSITLTSITTNSTWGPTGSPADSVYLINPSGSTLTISSGAVLTIQPGTRVTFASGKSMVIGSTTAGSLAAQGTPSSAIIFESSSGAVGGWGGIDFAANSDLGGASSLLEHCIIRRGGSGGYQIRQTSTNGVTLRTCVIEEHTGLGLQLSDARGITEGCVLRDLTSVGTYPASGDVRSVGGLFADNTFIPRTGGSFNAVQVTGSDLLASATLTTPDVQFCYLTSGDILVDNATAPVLTIAPLTVLKLSSGSTIRVGDGASGAVVARGAVFTSANDDTLGDSNGNGPTVGAPGQWNSILFDGSTSDAQAVLDSCIVRFGGAAYGTMIRLTDADPTITRCVIEQSSSVGLSAEGTVTPGGGVAGNLLRSNGSYELGGIVRAIGTMMVNNVVIASVDSRFNAYAVYTSDMTVSATLPRPPNGFCYVALGDILVDNATAPVLTIAPLTVLKLSSGSTIRVGDGASGAVVARGVVFTSANDDTLGDSNGNGPTVGAPGQWNSILFDGSTSDAQAVLDSCIVRFGGAAYGTMIRLTDADPTITRCVIEQSSSVGLSAEGTVTPGGGVAGNLLRSNGSYELGGIVRAIGTMMVNNVVIASVDSRFNAYAVYTSDMTVSATLPRPPNGFCYVALGDILVDNATAPVLTIAPLTVLKLSSGSTIRVGDGASGAVVARGVVFTSANDDTLGDSNGNGPTVGAPGQWNSILFDGSTSDAEAVLDSCIVRFGGAAYSTMIRITDASLSLRRCVIVSGAGNGLRVTGTSGTASVVDNRIEGNGNFELAAPMNNMPALVRTNDIRLASDGRFNGYDILGGSVIGSELLPQLQAPMVYYISASATVPASASLTIPAGTVLKFGVSTQLTVNGTLLVEGQTRAAPYAPVVFTSYRDDDWWGDTNGDGVSNGAATDWRRVEFGVGSNASEVRGAIFQYGGLQSLGQVHVLGTGAQTSPAVRFDDCHFYLTATGSGVRTNGSYARVDSCSFLGTTAMQAVTNVSPLITVDAQNCWWASPTGPLDASVLDPCTNPSGLGTAVSDYVNYCAWLTSQAPVTDAPNSASRILRTRFVSIGPVPTSGSVALALDLVASETGDLDLLDVSGRMVRRWPLARWAGSRYQVSWDGTDLHGRRVGAGVYFLRLSGSTTRETRTVIRTN